MLRVVYLLLCVSSAWLLAFAASASDRTLINGKLPNSASKASAHPNILLLVADDFGYNDSAIYQNVFHQQPVAAMPALESLANQGVRFTRFYTESTCSASRAALLTGQYPARNGFMPVARGISSDVLTLPEYLKSKGYVTHLVGKWHIGEINSEAFPQYQGFDTTFGFLSQWFLKGLDQKGRPALKPPTYHDPWLMETHEEKVAASYKKYHGHLEDILAEHTVDLIRQAKDSKQPWFIEHAFLAPHTPLEPAERFAEHFPNTPEGKYQALLAQLDDNVAQMVAALNETGQWDNTIIVFASDNGSPEKNTTSGHPSQSNAPFQGKKGEYEEGGIRTSLFIKWQKDLQTTSASLKATTTRTDVVSIMDIFPSLVAAIGDAPADVKNLDGMASLLPVNPQQRKTPLYFLSYDSLSVLSADGHYRLLRSWDGNHFTNTQLFEYDKSGIPIDISKNWLEKMAGNYKKTKEDLFNNFLQWRHQLAVVPLHVKDSTISGSNFLRTPINPSFAMAFSFTASDTAKKQLLLSQQGVVEVTLEKSVLHATLNGLSVKAERIKPGMTYKVVLSGEFYDRFSGVQNVIRASRLHLMVNGKEIASVSGQIDSFASIDVTAPTLVGKINGTISQPIIYSTQLLPNDHLFP